MTAHRADETDRTKPSEDQMHSAQPGAEDLVGEVATLAADPESDDVEIIRKLTTLAAEFSVDEVFAVIVRYDTPELLG